MRFNTVEKMVDGVKYVFVTKGKSKPFSMTEMNQYFNETKRAAEANHAVPFRIRDELRIMFLKDMRQFGTNHCMSKYGGTLEQITVEAARIAPYINKEFKE